MKNTMIILKRVFAWIKNNKLSVFLILVIVFNYLKNNFNNFFLSYQLAPKAMMKTVGDGYVSNRAEMLPEFGPPPPPTQLTNRLVIKESSLSLLVNNVIEAKNQILKKVKELGGYMVNTFLDIPQESANATLVLRVPTEKLDQVLNYFRQLSVKVISENLQGYDVTDEYVDIEARLATLLKTKAKFEEIFNKATNISDILNVQREIINIQSHIDAEKGRRQYLEQSGKLAKITVYLSTDELALPYAPSDSWRPALVFKQAVRSLVGNVRRFVNVLIWLGVYSVIWLPSGIGFFVFYRKKKN